MSTLTTSESTRLAGHHLSQVSGVCPRQADRSVAAQLLSIEPFIIVIFIKVVIMLWNRSPQTERVSIKSTDNMISIILISFSSRRSSFRLLQFYDGEKN